MIVGMVVMVMSIAGRRLVLDSQKQTRIHLTACHGDDRGPGTDLGDQGVLYLLQFGGF